MSSPILSKSNYLLYLKHPAWLWYKQHQPGSLPPDDANLEFVFKSGRKFEKLANQLFENQLELGHDDLPAASKTALKKVGRVVLQARLVTDQLNCICDVLVVKEPGIVDLYEIKASTKVKPEHIDDLAFQAVVIEANGYQLDKIKVIHVNGQYYRGQAIEIDMLTAVEDVSRRVRSRLTQTKTQIAGALDILAAKTAPDPCPELAASSALADWLKVYKHLFPPAADSLFQLGGLSKRQLQHWQQAKLNKLTDLDLADQQLRTKQRWQLKSQRQSQPLIDQPALKQFLDQLQFPLYFLDYETLAAVIPAFENYQPYRQYPFQYSLHILKTPKAELEHHDYLHTDQSDPSQALSARLSQDIGPEGTVLTWYMAFEKSCNRTLAQLQPDYQDFFEGLNGRIQDLMLPFSSGLYIDHRFGGSSSIKKVLPVLVPSLSYQQLAIQEGASAQRLWMENFLEAVSKGSETVKDDLIKYCQLDTLAMVEIYRQLLKAVA